MPIQNVVERSVSGHADCLGQTPASGGWKDRPLRARYHVIQLTPMAESERLTSGLSGVAGQFFVAAELSRRGYVATLTVGNTRGIDLLVARADASASVGVEVKTKQGSENEWILDKKSEVGSKNLVYVFVNLNDGKPPTFHVVPAKVVASYIRERHKKWLAGGAGRKDGSMRKFRDPEDRYLDGWKHLFPVKNSK